MSNVNNDISGRSAKRSPTLLIMALLATLSGAGLLVNSLLMAQDQTGVNTDTGKSEDIKVLEKKGDQAQDLKFATFGGGCFWCVEAVFEELDGVEEVVSGYEGGRSKDPTYKEVCTGNTGHAEVCRIKYDANKVEFKKLLQVFFTTHDPTTLNRQGNDFGTQYRSVVFYHDEEQKNMAKEIIEKLDEAKAFRSKIVTQVVPSMTFYEAEKEHQDYFANNPGNRYCAYVIPPKLEKLKKAFGDDLKSKSKK